MVYAVIRTFPGSAGFEVQNFLAATPVWLMASTDATATFFMMGWALEALDLMKDGGGPSRESAVHVETSVVAMLYICEDHLKPTGISNAAAAGDPPYNNSYLVPTCLLHVPHTDHHKAFPFLEKLWGTMLQNPIVHYVKGKKNLAYMA